MKIRMRHLAALAGALPIALSGTEAVAQQTGPVHTHVAHVSTSFSGAPGENGLAATASAEAGLAMLHANFAAGDLSDLVSMQRHTGHVLHLLDPVQGSSRPGLGLGVSSATEGVARHIGLAASSPGASQNVQTHAEHITTIANSVSGLAEEAAAVARRLQAATSIRRASPLVAQLRVLTYHIGEGRDRNGDGELALDGEAGLQQMEAHLYLLLEGEGLPRILR